MILTLANLEKKKKNDLIVLTVMGLGTVCAQTNAKRERKSVTCLKVVYQASS